MANNKRSPLNSRGFKLVRTKAIPHIAKKAKKDNIKALLLRLLSDINAFVYCSY